MTSQRVLKVNAPMSFGVLYLGPAVAEFMIRYDELKSGIGAHR